MPGQIVGMNYKISYRLL